METKYPELICEYTGVCDQERLTFGNKNFNHCNREKEYSSNSDEARIMYEQDMNYWRQYTQSAGAIDMGMCACGPNWMESEAAWHEQMKESTLKANWMLTKGFPLIGYVGVVPK